MHYYETANHSRSIDLAEDLLPAHGAKLTWLPRHLITRFHAKYSKFGVAMRRTVSCSTWI